MPSADELAAEQAETIRLLFNDWDSDGNGFIEREELRDLMFRLSHDMSMSDIDHLLSVVDTNGDGKIDIEEFVVWLTNPESAQTVAQDGWIESYSLSDALKPLFRVFDRNGDGRISTAEFRECHQILMNSMNICGTPENRTGTMIRTVSRELEAADADNSGDVDFTEFVQWQGALLDKAGIPNSHMPALIQELADGLTVIFDIEKLLEGGQDNAKSYAALKNNIKKIAETSQNLYTDKKQTLLESMLGGDGTASRTSVRIDSCWCDPPAHALPALIRKCAQELGLTLSTFQSLQGTSRRSYGSTQKASCGGRRGSLKRRTMVRRSVTMALGKVLIVPEPVERPDAARRWLARIQRQAGQGPTTVQTYYYEFVVGENDEHWSWDEIDAEEFNDALEMLAPELRVFAVLRAAALMAEHLRWSEVEDAFDVCVDMGLLAADAKLRYKAHMNAAIVKEIRASDVRHELKDMGKPLQSVAGERLEAMTLRPIEAFRDLVELDLLKASKNVWEKLGRSAR